MISTMQRKVMVEEATNEKTKNSADMNKNDFKVEELALIGVVITQNLWRKVSPRMPKHKMWNLPRH